MSDSLFSFHFFSRVQINSTGTFYSYTVVSSNPYHSDCNFSTFSSKNSSATAHTTPCFEFKTFKHDRSSALRNGQNLNSNQSNRSEGTCFSFRLELFIHCLHRDQTNRIIRHGKQHLSRFPKAHCCVQTRGLV